MAFGWPLVVPGYLIYLASKKVFDIAKDTKKGP